MSQRCSGGAGEHPPVSRPRSGAPAGSPVDRRAGTRSRKSSVPAELCPSPWSVTTEFRPSPWSRPHRWRQVKSRRSFSLGRESTVPAGDRSRRRGSPPHRAAATRAACRRRRGGGRFLLRGWTLASSSFSLARFSFLRALLRRSLSVVGRSLGGEVCCCARFPRPCSPRARTTARSPAPAAITTVRPIPRVCVRLSADARTLASAASTRASCTRASARGEMIVHRLRDHLGRCRSPRAAPASDQRVASSTSFRLRATPCGEPRVRVDLLWPWRPCRSARVLLAHVGRLPGQDLAEDRAQGRTRRCVRPSPPRRRGPAPAACMPVCPSPSPSPTASRARTSGSWRSRC